MAWVRDDNGNLIQVASPATTAGLRHLEMLPQTFDPGLSIFDQFDASQREQAPGGLQPIGELAPGPVEYANLPMLLAQGLYESGPGTMQGVMAGEQPVSDVLMTALDFTTGAAGTRAATGNLADRTVLSAGGAGPRRSTELPSLRGMDVDEATRIAGRNPHLIEAGDRSQGAYIGAPNTIQSRQDLTNRRRAFDKEVAEGAAGGDWYDRYRAAIAGVTDNPRDATSMAHAEGQFSAGVAPSSELAYTLKDNNTSIAFGEPVKAARPAQKEASMRAIAANDSSQHQLGKKTGEYARRIDPGTQERTGTGVNDFRYANAWGHTAPDGGQFNAALTDAQHNFLDYETANAVRRANEKNLAGRSDWTGEQIQAAPWVQQKSQALLDGTWKVSDSGKREWKPGRRKAWTTDAKRNLRNQGVTDPSPQVLEEEVQRIAFNEADKTIGDFFPKHTAWATREIQPYVGADHLPLLTSPEDRLALFNDPRASWDIAPNGRDGMYAGLRLGDTGRAMRVQPSIEATGVYQPPGDFPMETNPAMVSRPLVGINTPKSGPLKSTHIMDPGSRALTDAAEAVRGAIDVQGATPVHFFGTKAPVDKMNGVRVDHGLGRPLTQVEIEKYREVANKYGYDDVSDTGDGVTFTNFRGRMPHKDDVGRVKGAMSPKNIKAMESELGLSEGAIVRGRQEGNYPGYEGLWEQGEGSGAVTGKMMERLESAPPATQAAVDNNPYIPQVASMRRELYEDMALRFGGSRQDVQNLLEIISAGPGWMGRVKEAIAAGAVLPALGAFVLQDLGEQGTPNNSLPLLSGNGT